MLCGNTPFKVRNGATSEHTQELQTEESISGESGVAKTGLLKRVNQNATEEPLNAVRRVLMPLKWSFTKRKSHQSCYINTRN